MIDELTREKWNALFEVGGTDALWDEMQAHRQQDFENGHKRGEKEIQEHYDHLANIKGAIQAWAFSILGVGLLGFATYCLIQTQIRDGRKELAACASGNTSVCQQAEYDCKQLQEGRDKQSRLNLYLRTYKQATGHDLPKMEVEYGGD